MDRDNWSSPSRGRYNPHHSRFRGDGGGFGTPRNFSPQWQPRGYSPYNRFQSGGSFSPRYQSPHSFATSTPVHGSGGGRRPFFRGGGRFPRRQSFGSSFERNTSSSGENIDNWISPEMWSDPWRYLTPPNPDTTLSLNVDEGSSCTKLADSDFNLTDSTEPGPTLLPTAKFEAQQNVNDVNVSVTADT